MTETTWMPAEPLAYSIVQTAAVTGLSTRTIKRLLARRELIGRKVGSRVLIPRTSIEAFLKKDHETK